MKRKNKCLFICMMFILVFIFWGCASKDTEKDTKIVPIADMKLIYEETISPNEEYVESEEDVVTNSVEVYQDEDNTIFVNASSNSAFFDQLQYEVACDKAISKSDIAIEWTTLMGSSEPSEDDALVIANVSISDNGQVFSQRKINFMKKAIEVVIDTFNKNK